MRKQLLLSLSLLVMHMTFGQLTGTKTIPGDYTTIQAAVLDLNALGVGAGGVIFNVAAGHTETIAAVISLTASGTVANPIIFQKSGAGANPLITANTGINTPGSAIQDGIWNFVGSDFVTINGIDLYDPNSTNPSTMEYGYAFFPAATDNGCQNNIIKNCVVTLSRENNASGSGPSVEGSKAIQLINALAATQTTAMTPTAASGTNSNNQFYSNTLQNCNYGILVSGYAASTPFDLGDTGNDIGGASAATGNTIINFGGATGATNASAGIRVINQWGINISYNTLNNNNGSGINHVSALRGIYAQSGTSASANINNNTLTIKGGGTTSQVTMIENAIGSTAAGNTININNNILTGDYLTATSGAFYGIFSSSSAATVNINNNTLTNFIYSGAALTGSGAIYPIYNSGSATAVNANGNTISNISRTGSTGGTTIGIYISSGTTQTVNNNSISNIGIDGAGSASTLYGIQVAGTTVVVNGNLVHTLTCIKTTGTSALYGIYDISSPTNENFNNNIIRDLTHNGTGTIYGIYTYTTSGVRTVSGNQVYNLTGAGTTIIAINQQSSSPNIFKNKIYNIQSTSTGTPLVSGIQIAGLGSSGVANVYNNLIGDIKAPSANSSGPASPSVRGINVTSTTSTSALNFSYNTIYLNAGSSGANFSTAGLFVTTSATATTSALTLKNNIIINKSTPAGTGLSVAYQRSSTALNNFVSESNNNLYYAGAPGAARLIFYDGTNLVQTLANYKALVTPRESFSITEDANFKSLSGPSADFLHVSEIISTQIESSGLPIATITDDFDGNARNATTPDIGADEFNGILLDLVGPTITLTPLMNISTTGDRTLTTMISDLSGVPTSGAGLPRLYWKINAGAYTGVTATWVSGNTYTFTFGAGVTAGDVVSYYVVAQDNASTPNVVASPITGASGYTANPPACSTPPTTPYSYTIVGALSGTYAVGAGQTYATITAAIADLNFKEVVAPVTFELWDATYPSETFPLLINQYAGMDASRPVTFRPKNGVVTTVSGSSATGILVMYGADHIKVDGSNSGGTDRSLTWENTNNVANAYVIGIFNNGVKGAQYSTVKNCVIKAGGKVNTTWGVILNASGGDFDNTTIQNNQILNAMIGMQFVGVASGITNNGLITNNIIGSPDDALTCGNVGMNISNVGGLVISNNIIQNLKTSSNPKGINLGANSLNVTIRDNVINGIIYTGTSGYGGKGIDINTGSMTSNLVITNNAISQILGDGWNVFSTDAVVGIRILGTTGGIKIYHNSINLTGTLSRSGATTDASAALYVVGTAGNLDVRNNIFLNSLENTTGVATAYSIYSDAAAGAFTNINYNDYFVSGPEGVLAYLGAQRTTLAAWQGATGQDANSQNVDPLFVSASDLHANAASLDNTGVYLLSVPADLTGNIRSNPPDIGAYEFGTNPAVNTLSSTGIDCSGGTLHGTINANGLSVDAFFDYGPTTAYGNSIVANPATVTGTTTTDISGFLAMPPATTYHFRTRGVYSGGVEMYGPDMMITSSPTGAPQATTQLATNILADAATLNGIVNALCFSTTVTFEYGETAAYGFSVTADQSPLNSGIETAVSAALTGLGINTLYHFRVKAESTNGTTYGEDITFTTGANPPAVTTTSASNIGNFAASLNGIVTANNQVSTVTFEYGLTTSYGSTVAGVPATVNGSTPTTVYADISGLDYNTTYHFRCVGQNNAGTTYGDDMMFTTLCPVPQAAGTITGPTAVCQATNGHVYTVPAITYAYNGYVWTVPTGGTIVGGNGTNSITVNYSSSAVSGNVTVYGTSVCGNGTPSSLAVTINPLPVPTINGPAIACITSTYTYSTQAGMSAYAWTVSSGGQIMSGAGTNTVSIKWNNSGAQAVSVTYNSAAGCPAAAPGTLNVSVGTLPTPSIAGADIVCVNGGIQVYTTQTGFFNYVWTISQGGTILTGQGTYQIEVDWLQAGDRSVSVNYETTSGCDAANPATFAVEVWGLPGNAGPVEGPQDVCTGETYVSYDTPPIPNADNYIWTLPAGATIVEGENTNHIKVDFAPDAESGEISVHGESVCGAGQASPPFNVHVIPVPETPVASVDEYFVLHSSSPSGNQWYLNGEIIEGANGQDYTAEEEGTYWTVVTINGCVSEESNHVDVIFTGLGEVEGTSFSIYPVPNDGKFTATIVIPGEDKFTISVYNELGSKVYEKNNIQVDGKAQQVIDLGNPGRGVYSVIFKGNDLTVIRKVLVTR